MTLPGSEDSAREIVTVSMPLEDDRYSSVKEAMQGISEYITECVNIDRPRSEYDCTGVWFTYDLERVNRFVAGGYLHYVLVHYVACDV